MSVRRVIGTANPADGGRLAGLADAVVAAKVVSFDFFDTLFLRPLADPEDLFDLIGERHGIAGFRRLRCAAQRLAFEAMAKRGRNEIDIDGIYACLEDTGVSADELKRTECQLELEVTCPNPEMLAVFNQAVRLGKTVVIASDMYLPAEHFRALMRREQLPEVPMFISADRDATKRDRGALFDILVAELGVSPDQVLHIGDNRMSDHDRAVEKGLRAFHYTEARVPARRKNLTPAASVARGLVRLHQDEVPHASLHALGFTKGGPAAVGFLDWIAEQAVRDRIDHILFVSRDGYILEKLVASGRAEGDGRLLPRSSYFLGSRTCFTLAAMTDASFADHVEFLLSGSDDLSPTEALERIGVPAPAASVMEGLGLGPRVTLPLADSRAMQDFLFAWRWEILKVARRNRRGLLRHLLDQGIRAGQHVALVDIGWNGTTQDAFERAVAELLPLDVTGYYFCLTDSADCQKRQTRMEMKALVTRDTVGPDLLAAVYANRVIGEFFFSAPHNPVIGYLDGKGGPVALEDPGRSDSSDIAPMIDQVVRGMLHFAESFSEWRGRLGVGPDPLGLAMPLLEYMADGAWADDRLFWPVKNFDAWASSKNRDMWLTDYAVRRPIPG